MKSNPSEVATLCLDCAHAIWGAVEPSPKYARATARLLLGTAAQESNFLHRRQLGFGWDSIPGAWGLWQTEIGSVRDNLAYLKNRPSVMARAGRWLYQYADAHLAGLYGLDDLTLLRTIAGWERLAVLMARIHYCRVPEPIPEGLAEQSVYWKRYYNTIEGHGTPEQYLNSWKNLAQWAWDDAEKLF